jgi:cyclopropane-fatty-acyl-phospholipid synthase
MDKYKKFITKLLGTADIKVGGTRPWDIKVHNNEFYRRVVNSPSIGLGESYMDGWFDCKKLDEFFFRILRTDLDKKVKFDLNTTSLYLKSRLMNLQSRYGARKVMHEHYNLTPQLYMSFLDPYNQYTCGYFKGTKDLNKAQEQKLDLICKKIGINKKDKVLDIGCGWGGFAKFAAKKYGCEVTGISISEEQIKYAKEYTKGLKVRIKYCDYRDLNEKFDKIVTIGMIEHVGYKNYRNFFKKAHESLEDDGLFLLHTIVSKISKTHIDPWIQKYIFPNAMLPSIKQLSEASEGLLIMEDLHNFGHYYDPTLMAWHENFERNWHRLKGFDYRFRRMWNYYLLCCAGGFRARDMQLFQTVFSKKGLVGGYEPVR